jgi:hypothetical protein
MSDEKNGGSGNGDKLGELRKKFFVDEDLVATRLEALAEKVRRFCTVDVRGNIHVREEVKGAKNQVMVALSARAVAARLNPEIADDMTVAELAGAATPRLTNDVVSARCAELVKDNYIDSPRRGSYRIRHERIERFLDSLSAASVAA